MWLSLLRVQDRNRHYMLVYNFNYFYFSICTDEAGRLLFFCNIMTRGELARLKLYFLHFYMTSNDTAHLPLCITLPLSISSSLVSQILLAAYSHLGLGDHRVQLRGSLRCSHTIISPIHLSQLTISIEIPIAFRNVWFIIMSKLQSFV